MAKTTKPTKPKAGKPVMYPAPKPKGTTPTQFAKKGSSMLGKKGKC